MFTILLIVLSSHWGGDDYTHAVNASGTLNTFVEEALPQLPEDLTFVFWLRGLIEIVRSFQLRTVYVPVLLCMRPCLG